MMNHKADQVHDICEQLYHRHEHCSVFRSIMSRDWNDVVNSLKSDNFVKKIEQESEIHSPSFLHIACSISAVPVEVVEGIIHCYGSSCCNIHDEDGNLPVHIACSTSGINASIIRKLLLSSPPTSFARSDFDGETPFGLLIQQGSHGVQIINAILKDLPRTCFINEEKGTSIFHELCTESIPESIMIQILELYPDIAAFQDSAHGNSIAHMICSQRHGTASMLRAIMSSNHKLASLHDNLGNLPLHLVNSNQDSEEMIQILLSIYPQGIKSVNKEMETPFSSKLIRSSPEKIRALIRHSHPTLRDDSLRTRNAAGMLPIEVSFYHLQHYLSAKCHNEQFQITSDILKDLHHKDILLQNMVGSIMNLLHATCHNANDQWSHHHASFWLSYPLITKLIIQQYPQILSQYDCVGNLPLHVIAKSEAGPRSTFLCTSCHEEVQSGLFFWLNENHLHCPKCNYKWKQERMRAQLPLIGYQGHSILKDMITAYPTAVKSVDSEGNLPLHLSLHSGKSWFEDGVKDLIHVAPETICTRDKDGSPPAMIAAPKCDLTTLYELMSRDPECGSG